MMRRYWCDIPIEMLYFPHENPIALLVLGTVMSSVEIL